MTVPPFNELRLKPGEKPDQRRLEELFDGIYRNFEDAYEQLASFQKGLGMEAAFIKAAAGGKHRVSWGAASLTWTASANAAPKEIEHKLGATPTAVLATSGNPALNFAVSTFGATKFKAEGLSIIGAVTGTFIFFWIAIS